MQLVVFVIERIPGQIEQAILNREVDLGITYAPVPNENLDFLKICQFEKKIFIREGALAGVSTTHNPFSAPMTPVHG